MSNSKNDVLIDTLHDLRNVLDDCIGNIQNNTGKNSSDKYPIDVVEEEFHNLNLKTNNIYTKMLSKLLEEKETKALIESKKENI
jgi:hypothetical protein